MQSEKLVIIGSENHLLGNTDMQSGEPVLVYCQLDA